MKYNNKVLYKDVYVTQEQKARYEWLDSMYAEKEYVPSLKQMTLLYNQTHTEPVNQGTLWYAVVQWGVINKIATGYGERKLQKRRKSPTNKKIVGKIPFVPDSHTLFERRQKERLSYAEAIREAVEMNNTTTPKVKTNYKTTNTIADRAEMGRVLGYVDGIEKMRHLSYIFLNIALITLVIAIIATLIK